MPRIDPYLPSFQSFADAVSHGRKLLAANPDKREVFAYVHVHVIVVTRDAWCHVTLYPPYMGARS